MKSKKVLFTSHTANFSKFNRPFMRWFTEQGYEVHYASAGEELVLDCNKHFTIPFERNPLKINNILAYKKLKQIIDSEKYDIIHTHTPVGGVITRLAARNARKNGTRVIYTAHGFHFFKGAPLINWLTYYPIEKFMAKYTNTLITINKEDYERARSKFKTYVRYVPGVGIDPKKFDFKMSKTQKIKLRQSLGLSDNDFVMIYPAELNKNKNQLWLIDSIAELIKTNPSMHLLLPGIDSLNGKCQKLVTKLGVDKNIHFLGYRTDIPKLLKISNLSVSSSLREGLPVNIIESMYVGLSIIAVECRGIRELLLNYYNSFLIGINKNRMMVEQIVSIYEDMKNKKNIPTIHKSFTEKYLSKNVLVEMQNIYFSKITVIHLLNTNKFSGAENVACEIISNSDSDKYKMYYCSPSGAINEKLANKCIEYIKINKLSYRNLREVVKKYRPDVVHAHDFRASIIASFFSNNTKVISHIHQNPDWINNRHSIYYILYKIIIGRLKNIIVVSREIKDSKLLNRHINDKVNVIYNLVNATNIPPNSRNNSKKRYDICFCGRLENVKNPFDFIDIVKILSENNKAIKAVIVGDGSLFDSCARYINKLSLDSNIDMVGFQNNPYIYMCDSRFVLITSKTEGFPLVVIEAILSGCLVISYDISGVREILGGQSTLLCRDMYDIASKYVIFTNNDKMYEEYRNSSNEAVKNFPINSKDWSLNFESLYE